MLGMILFLERARKDFQEKEAFLLKDKTEHWKHGDRSTDPGRGRVQRRKGHSSKEFRSGGGERWKVCFLAGKEGWMQLLGENRRE